jgi:hypothetical protein
MADLSVADYEAALDDITRRGVAAIRHTGDTQHTWKTVQRPIYRGGYAGRRSLDGGEASAHGVSDAIVQSIKARPYATLAIAGLIGFACAALRR